MPKPRRSVPSRSGFPGTHRPGLRGTVSRVVYQFRALLPGGPALLQQRHGAPEAQNPSQHDSRPHRVNRADENETQAICQALVAALPAQGAQAIGNRPDQRGYERADKHWLAARPRADEQPDQGNRRHEALDPGDGDPPAVGEHGAVLDPPEVADRPAARPPEPLAQVMAVLLRPHGEPNR